MSIETDQHDGREQGRLQSIPGYHGPPELAGDDILRVTRALLLLTTASEKITFETADSPPPRESAAHRLYSDAEVRYAIDGFLTMQYANLSAYDHVRGFVALVRSATVRSTALATVARGALESLARTWYLLEHDDVFVYRVISLLRSDLRFPEKLGETVRTRDGDLVDPVKKRAFYADELRRLRLPAPAPTDLALMVSTMLDTETEQSHGRMRYSALSSIAHGQRLGINTFIATTDNGQITGLAAPRPVVVDLVGQLVAALYGTSSRFIRFYGNQTRHVELLDAAMQRALRALEPVNDSIWPDD